ncbi:hypothetical protein BpHYR1_001825 [Brachionus plicatilis]|uniref:Uncharacterized protein n=1 Tax=Brachionus plicatilis TaxID=10195 RepID=A0A3M7SKD2_BRAPC|nr:hypothetical protein BpHYR1_001825 [Brachionus plicatilis]
MMYFKKRDFLTINDPFHTWIDQPSCIRNFSKADDLYDFSAICYRPTQKNQGCQYEQQITKTSSYTQTVNPGSSKVLNIISQNFTWNNVGDLICIFADKIGDWNAIHFRIFSVIIYLILHMSRMGKYIVDEDDLCVILREKRGSYKRILFYEMFPELELEAKAFVLSKCCQKEGSFDAIALANFVNKRYREMFPNNNLDDDELLFLNSLKGFLSCLNSKNHLLIIKLK